MVKLRGFESPMGEQERASGMMSMAPKLGAAEIAAYLRRDITNGEFACQDRLPPERQLAEKFSVARGTIREALTRLAQEGYVEIRAGSGSYVTYQPPQISADAIRNASPLELIDARFALEPHICRLVILHGRRSDFARLEVECLRMEDSLDDPITFADADMRFHQFLAEATGNGLLIWVIGQINSVRTQDDWTRMRHLTLNRHMIAEYNAQHRAILDAIRARAPEQAANLMKAHLETARLSLTRASET